MILLLDEKIKKEIEEEKKAFIEEHGVSNPDELIDPKDHKSK